MQKVRFLTSIILGIIASLPLLAFASFVAWVGFNLLDYSLHGVGGTIAAVIEFMMCLILLVSSLITFIVVRTIIGKEDAGTETKT